ncbi:hypothetical protein [uncultured Bacteroides sp.]|uniref:hypothetical protein n=1 Tax=uncultured Bacteroides sp. TaxID=162156 RepID=UPI0027D9550F|nr:hypothetical protein [uncultured Bacteroides sp.]
MKSILLSLLFILAGACANTIYAQDIQTYSIEKSILTNLEETEVYENLKATGNVSINFKQKNYLVKIAFEDAPNDYYTIKGTLKKNEPVYFKDADVKEEMIYSCSIIMDDEVDNGNICIEKLYNGDIIISFLSNNSGTIRSIYVK